MLNKMCNPDITHLFVSNMSENKQLYALYLDCTDTPGWVGGLFNDEDCSTIAKYACKNGRAELNGKAYNYPEKNCCKCGKGKGRTK